MAKINRGKGRSTPKISTASLPDIIFILLFFFMVVTVMKDSELKVQVNYPYATELQKLEKKSLVSYIYMGVPARRFQKKYGSAPRMQLNDKFSEIKDLKLFIEQERAKLREAERARMTASIRADKDVTMGIVTDVKTELRKINQLKVNYSSKPRTEDIE